MQITRYFHRFLEKLKLVNLSVEYNYDNLIDIKAAQQLQPLLNGLPYLPHTTVSLRHSSIMFFLNDILLNNRKVIVEFGSGISTILLCKMIRQLALKDVKLISIDNNHEWLKIVKSYICQETNDDVNADFLVAELKKCEFSPYPSLWYDTAQLHVLEQYKGHVDCVLVDGPEAWRKKNTYSRYPALPFIHDYLAQNCSIFLDDTDRIGEKAIVELGREKYAFKKKTLNSSFTRLSRGTSFRIK